MIEFLTLSAAIVAALGVYLMLAVFVPFWLWDDHRRPVLAIGVTVVANIVGLAGLLAALTGGDDGVHRWRGGAGPATVCGYESRTVMVGKVPTQVTETVCRDPR